MKISFLLAKANQAVMVLAAFWAFLLAVNIAVDVFCRAAFNHPLLGTVEIIRNSIVMIAFLQLPYAVFSKSMLRADFLLHVMPKPMARGFEFLGACMGAALFAVLVYGAIEPMVTAFISGEFEGEGDFRIPVWPIYCVIILGSVLATINYVVAALAAWTRSGES